MGAPANIREQINFWGFNKQDDIATINENAGLWRLNKLNAGLVNPNPILESDADEFGKGHEFATALIKSHYGHELPSIEGYNSAHRSAFAMVFGLGKCTKSGGAGNFVYTCTPLDLAVDGLELPYYTFGQAIRQGAEDILDVAAIGCAVEGWTINVATGPGRTNSRIVIDQVYSGKFARPSGLTIPAATTEKLLPGASLTATINGVDYVTPKNLVSLTASWKNNLRVDDGFYPGSGFQSAGDATSGAIRGRLEVGNRQLGLQFVARYRDGSAELTKLLALTTGTAVIVLTYDANNKLTLTYQKVAFTVAELGDTDGIVTVAVTCEALYHSGNGLITAEAKVSFDGIGEATP